MKASDLRDHKYVADIAVAKISKNIARLQEIEEQKVKVDTPVRSQK